VDGSGPAEDVWDALMAAGKTRGIRADRLAGAQHGAHRGRLHHAQRRFRLGRAHDPHRRETLAASNWGSDWLVDFERAFQRPPRAARRAAARAAAQLVGLDIEGNKPAHNALLYADAQRQREIGSVTSAIWSPTCKRNIALAMVDAPHTSGSARRSGRRSI
jgi:aminomethyltransferase